LESTGDHSKVRYTCAPSFKNCDHSHHRQPVWC
jgi:hypothetical protein